MADNPDIQTLLTERFAQLPKVVQDAITSADVEKRMREMAETNKLHLDQWEKLENEVMMTLFGVVPVDELQNNIVKHVGVSEETAAALASGVSKIVFQPIREELERSLEHPEAKAANVTGVEGARAEILSTTSAEKDAETPAAAPPPTPLPTPELSPPPPAPASIPSTPPQPSPGSKVERAPISSSYAGSQASHARKTIAGDPYREQIA